MKQTAVEWLIKEFNLESYQATCDFAKAMEKEQMRQASCPYVGGWEEGEFEDWYNETFKSE